MTEAVPLFGQRINQSYTHDGMAVGQAKDRFPVAHGTVSAQNTGLDLSYCSCKEQTHLGPPTKPRLCLEKDLERLGLLSLRPGIGLLLIRVVRRSG